MLRSTFVTDAKTCTVEYCILTIPIQWYQCLQTATKIMYDRLSREQKLGQNVKMVVNEYLVSLESDIRGKTSYYETAEDTLCH